MKTSQHMGLTTGTLVGRASRRALDEQDSAGASPHRRKNQRRGRISFILHSSFFLLPSLLLAATNDPTSALQKGLFEEEANHNLAAAIQAYQSVVSQLDQDRKLAATAVFRLGECYRKLGRTNDAVAQYERVLRDFSDQSALATLSRQDLAGFGVKRETPASSTLSRSARLAQERLLNDQIKLVEQDIADVKKQFEVGRATQWDIRVKEREVLTLRQQLAALDLGAEEGTVSSGTATGAAELAAQLDGIEKLRDQPEQRARAVLALYPDDDLKTMLLNLPKLQEQVARFKADPTLKLDMRNEGFHVAIGPGGRGVRAFGRGIIQSNEPRLPEAQAEVQEQLSLITQRVDFIVGLQKARLQVLQAAAGSTASHGTAKTSSPPPGTDEEDKEIRRIRDLIQNSPDLINAPDSSGTLPLIAAANRGQLRVAQFLLDSGADVNRSVAGGQTALHAAAANGHKAMVELLLARGAAVSAKDSSLRTPLHAAAEKGYRTVAESLLAKGAEVNAADSKGNTPLHLAAEKAHAELVQLLLQRGAAVNAQNQSGQTPLIIAAQRGYLPIVAALLAAKADPNLLDSSGHTALSLAAGNGQVDTVKTLLDAKADPNAGTLNLPLAISCRLERTNVADLLLRAGADPNREAPVSFELRFSDRSFGAGTGIKATPLQVAVGLGRADLARMFFQFKADPKARRAFSDWPLVWETFANTDLLKAFLEAGADPNADGGGANYPLLYMAAANGNASAVEALLAAGARVNPSADAREIPLHAAVQKGDEKTIRLLLDGGAEVNRRNRDDYTPLMQAVANGKTEIAALLLAHGADPNLAKRNDGNTPLYWAILQESRPLVQLLLTNKAEVNLRNKDGQTPLDLAKGRLAQPGMAGAVFLVPPPSVGVLGGPLAVQGSAGREPPRASAASLADLLREHGALEWAPRPGQITVTRRSAGVARTVFEQGTNLLNRFTLFEAVAALPWWGPTFGTSFGATAAVVPFPDFSKVMITRRDPRTGKLTDIPVDVAALVASGDCSKDFPLEWGDLVDIPDTEHKLNDQWQGLPTDFVKSLAKCLERKVTVEVKGQPQPITLWPQLVDRYSQQSLVTGNPVNFISLPFHLKDALTGSARLLSTSDLTRVKVRRADPATGQTNEWVFNEQTIDPTNDLWLRDGDVIEVPEK